MNHSPEMMRVQNYLLQMLHYSQMATTVLNKMREEVLTWEKEDHMARTTTKKKTTKKTTKRKTAK